MSNLNFVVKIPDKQRLHLNIILFSFDLVISHGI